ncbi:MAG: beta-lactamase family protein, partial [Planctomycetes bacterium]|nr:beta-lactamase family protein [Planctomycetota bacterium]
MGKVNTFFVGYFWVVLLLMGGCFGGGSVEKRIAKVENSLTLEWGDAFWERMNLVERMAYYKVPGVSIAVINDFEIEWAKGYGVLAAGSDGAVTEATLFQSGSIGKPIVAAA